MSLEKKEEIAMYEESLNKNKPWIEQNDQSKK